MRNGLLSEAAPACRGRDGRVDGLHPQALEVDHHEVVGGDTGAAGAADTQCEIAPVGRKG